MTLCRKEIWVVSLAESCNDSFGTARTWTFPFSSDYAYDYIHVHHSWSCENQTVWVESKSGRKKLLSELHYLFPCKLWLNPSTIDGCWEGAWWNRRGLQVSLEGNHDHPESGTHRTPSHWESQWKRCRYLLKWASREEGGLGAINNYNYCTQKKHEQNDWLLRQHCKITKALLNPKTASHTISGGDRWPAFSCV